ncbi:L-amino acid N-acyltransferase YncA [Sphingomonas sp. PP-CE-1G-424]|nr:GNAT family N-acetyltransferase [Sphingomonas sp. PP-CE-1G-424]TCP73219.1 L-amino acid N-acyltransferase YncA [Sphingomonas sp. PP-CE-1G-424]
MIAYRHAVPTDGAELAAMAKRSFTDTFGTLYRPEDLAAFLEQTFGEKGLPAQLSDPAFTVRVAVDEAGAIVGFAKIGPVAFPGDWPATAIELHQLYVRGDQHGAGVGPALMDWAIDVARADGRTEMILSVYVDNHRAHRFYQRYGFVEIGRYVFMVGQQPDDDRIMRLVL